MKKHTHLLRSSDYVWYLEGKLIKIRIRIMIMIMIIIMTMIMIMMTGDEDQNRVFVRILYCTVPT